MTYSQVLCNHTPHHLKVATALAKAALPHGWQATTQVWNFKTGENPDVFTFCYNIHNTTKVFSCWAGQFLQRTLKHKHWQKQMIPAKYVQEIINIPFWHLCIRAKILCLKCYRVKKQYTLTVPNITAQTVMLPITSTASLTCPGSAKLPGRWCRELFFPDSFIIEA